MEQASSKRESLMWCLDYDGGGKCTFKIFIPSLYTGSIELQGQDLNKTFTCVL